MEKEFITYEQALALKELGFDETCFGSYVRGNEYKDWTLYFKGGTFFAKDYPEFITAPLYQQAFRWFREKYNITQTIARDGSLAKNGPWAYTITSDYITFNDGYLTYEEAESKCLDKLIEIVKKK